MFSLSINIEFSTYLVSFCPFDFLDFVEKCNKIFTFHTSPLTSGHLQKIPTGIKKSHGNYFAKLFLYIKTIDMKDLYSILKVV